MTLPRPAGAVGIPSARNVHHVGLVVPDLDQAIAFFTDVIGCEYVFTTGPFVDETGDSMATSLNAHPRASLMVAFLRCGPVTNLELLEWRVPGEPREAMLGTDVGSGHLAFQVTDIDAAVAYLRGHDGVRVLGEPMTVGDDQPSGGSRFIYFLAPWGMQMELLSFPDSMPFHGATAARLFGPAPAWAGTEPIDSEVVTS